MGVAAAAAVGIVLSGAASPSFFAQMNLPGLWEIDRNGFEPRRLCLASSQELAQLEHVNARCSRTVIHDSRSEAVVHYTCRGGDFGQSRMTMLTPRSIRIETQGISGGSPFHYTFQARRVGSCPAH
jgi:hypothetical protein